MLELKQVTKHYHETAILDIPSFKLENGIYWLKGINGSGKTTLFKLVAGLLPFEGDITIDNISIKKEPVIYRQKISWAATEPLYPAFITGMNLISLYCAVRKVARKEVDCLLQYFNMTAYIDTTVGAYSAGMIKKLSLVLAFLGNQNWIVLDEPLITLDTDAHDKTLSLIIERNKHAGTSFLISSHQELEDTSLYFSKQLLINNKTIVFK